MAEVNAKDLTTKTTPASTDSMLLFGTTSNEGAKITVDNLADNILGRLTTKTFANQVGGSSAATLLAQLSTLNSNLGAGWRDIKADCTVLNDISVGAIRWQRVGTVNFLYVYFTTSSTTFNVNFLQLPEYARGTANVYAAFQADLPSTNQPPCTVAYLYNSGHILKYFSAQANTPYIGIIIY